MSGLVSVRELVRPVAPFSAVDTIAAAAERLLSPTYQQVLSVPVVADERPVGMLSRHQLNEIFLRRFGRDLFGVRHVAEFMSPNPLIVEVNQRLTEAAAYVTANMSFPMTEDFIVVDAGRYLGVGAVLDLLAAMERQAHESALRLTRTLQVLRAQQAQLIQSEKMAALGQMVAGVAHEINTPLGYVKNNLEMIREIVGQSTQALAAYESTVAELLAPERNPQSVATSLAQLDAARETLSGGLLAELDTVFADTLHGMEQIGELVLGLKDFSRLEEVLSDDVALNDCVESTLLIARSTLKYKVDVVKQLTELPRIRCAPSQVNQVLLNLFTNAAQAIPEQGRLFIRTWCDAQWVYVSVQDTGSGIAPEHLGKIFEPFFTTKPPGQGTGLGLYISYQIVQRHHGRIQVGSKVGVGTRFVIALPRQQPQALAKAG